MEGYMTVQFKNLINPCMIYCVITMLHVQNDDHLQKIDIIFEFRRFMGHWMVNIIEV